MTSLKYHLLCEVADIVFRDSAIWSKLTPTIPTFALSGKNPAFIVRRLVQNEFITVYPNEYFVFAGYGIRQDIAACEALSTLMTLWARKLIIRGEKAWCPYPCAHLRLLWKNKNVEALSVDETNPVYWADVFKMFPKLVSIQLKASQFYDMLREAPNKLAGLKEIGITFPDWNYIDPIDVWFANISLVLCKHQAKYPALEVVQFNNFADYRIQYPAASMITGIPSVKHLKVDAVRPYTFSDINLRKTARKMFPSLTTFDIDGKNVVYW